MGGGILDFYLTGCLLPDGIGSFVCDLLRIVIGLELLLLTFICASQMSRPNFIVYIGIQRPIIIRISCRVSLKSSCSDSHTQLDSICPNYQD